MAGFDTNALMPTPLPRQTNPLEFASQAIGVRNALLGNKIRQSEYDSRIAAGNALLGNTDATGNVNWDKARGDYAQSARSNPSLALGAADNFSANNTARSGTAKATDDELAFQEHARDAVAGAFIRSAQNPTDANIRGAAALTAHLTPGARDQIISTTRGLLALPTAAQRSEAIKTLATATLPGHERINQAFGTPTSVDDGQTIQTGTQASGMDGGAFTPAAGVQRRTGPEFNATYTNRTIMGPNGPVTIPMTQSQFDAYNGTHNGFTGRVDVTGNAAAPLPPTAIPAGAEEQAKIGLAVRNNLAGQQEGYTQSLSTLRNLDGLLSRIPADQRSRRLVEVENLLSKAGINFDGATLAQEIDKAGASVRTQLMNDGSGPHTNAGLSDLEHITPGRNMTPEAARALTNEMITAMEYKQRRAAMAQRIQNPGTIMQELSNYDQNFDPRFFTIQRLGPQEGRAYAASHVADKAQYATSVRRMAQAQRDGKYDYGLTPDQVDRILGQKNAQ